MAGAVVITEITSANSNPCTPPHDAVKVALRQLARDLYLTPTKRPRRHTSRSRSPPRLLDESDTESVTDSSAPTLVYSPAVHSPALEDYQPQQ